MRFAALVRGVRALTLAGLVPLGASCMVTQEATERIADLGNPRREFVRSEARARHAGWYAGDCELRGDRARRYRFPGLLTGEPGRILEIVVSERGDGDGRECVITEKSEPGERLGPARLLLTFSPYRRYLDRDISIPVEAEPRAFRHSDDADAHLIVLEFHRAGSGRDEVSAYVLPPGTGRSRRDWVPLDPDVQLRWVVRSRAGYLAAHAHYLYAVPMDIVFAPLYAILLLTVGPG